MDHERHPDRPPDGGDEAPERTADAAAGEAGATSGRVRRARWHDGGKRRIAGWLGGGLLLVAVVGFVLWQRCGIAGCPDVDRLRGYMPDEASVVLDRDGDEIAKLFVTRRVYIGLDSLPQHVPDAFVAMEDQRFWDHGGVDLQRVIGAMVTNLRSGGVEEGASTITMQLARNVFPDELPASQKTIWRKLGEARVARAIEDRYSKQEIIELYLNQIYFGEGAWGIEAASQEYFGKSATELTLAEAATLAALPRAPSRLNPRVNRDLAREERAVVLDRMLEQGLIDQAERDEAAEVELTLRRGDRDVDDPRRPRSAPGPAAGGRGAAGGRARPRRAGGQGDDHPDRRRRARLGGDGVRPAAADGPARQRHRRGRTRPARARERPAARPRRPGRAGHRRR